MDYADNKMQKIDRPIVGISRLSSGVIAGVIVLSITILVTLTKCEPDTTRPMPAKNNCEQCHNRQVYMTEYLRRSGCPTPEEMAIAVLRTKSPRLMAALSVKGEKNTPYTSRNGGFKRAHAGAWQLHRSHQKRYGVVPNNLVDQALQAERLLTDMVMDEKDIVKVLNQWGGDTRGYYARRVLAELENVP